MYLQVFIRIKPCAWKFALKVKVDVILKSDKFYITKLYAKPIIFQKVSTQSLGIPHSIGNSVLQSQLYGLPPPPIQIQRLVMFVEPVSLVLLFHIW